MPGILIKEQEDLSLGQLSVLENVVLAPLFVESYLKDDYGRDIKVKKYTLYSKFKNDMMAGGEGGSCILLKDYLGSDAKDSVKTRPEKFDIKIVERDSEGKVVQYDYYNVDQSYHYITELLGMGLHVVVKFIGPDLLSDYLDSEGHLIHDHSSEEKYDRDDEDITFDEKLEIIINKLVMDTDDKFGIFEEFKDRNLYNLKFITTGAHSNLLITQKEVEEESSTVVIDVADTENSCFDTLVKVAAKRGDALALIEIQNDYDLSEQGNTFINRDNLLTVFSIDNHNYEFAACFYPWGVYQMNYSDSKNHEMPAGFGYLMAFAYSIQVNDDWFAASGVSRGFIPNLISLNYQVGDSFMHVLQCDERMWYDRDDFAFTASEEGEYLPIRINPIMFKGAYGNRVWGNRTFSFLGDDGITAATHSNISFREYLNVRMLLCDIKKQIYGAATRVTFEPNDDITWINFKGLVNNLLDRMQNGRGLEYYHWQKEFPDDGHGNRRKATIKATLTIKPIEAVEYFDITVFLTDEDAVVAEPVI